MPSNKTRILPNPMNSYAQFFIPPAIPRRRRKPQKVAVAFRLKGTHKKHSGNAVNFGTRVRKSDDISARKLAARFWKLRFMDLSCDGAHFGFHSSQFKLESSRPCLKRSKEEATECNPALIEESNEYSLIHSDFYVTIQLEEILQAQMSINKAQKSIAKRVERFLQNLKEERVFWKCRDNVEEERVFWKGRDSQKIKEIIDDLKYKLVMERRSRKKMDLQNTNLTNKLAKNKLCAKQFMTKYEKQKKEIKLLREVCNKLAVQVRDEKAKLEGLQSDSMKICKEVEEERNMMQITEQWREERVQMKLDDAKFVFENKYNQMVQLISFLQMFFRSKGADTVSLEDVELIKQAVESVNIQRIEELSCDFSKLENAFPYPNVEEFTKENKGKGEKVIKPNSYSTLTSPLATKHSESLDKERLNKNSVLHQLSPSCDYDTSLNLASTNSSKSVGHIEDQMFSSTSQRRETNFCNANQEKDILGREAECSGEKACSESLKKRVDGAFSVLAGKSKGKASLGSKKLRSCPNDGTMISSPKSSKHRRPGDGWNEQKKCKKRVSMMSPIQNYVEATSSPSKDFVKGSFKHSKLSI